MNKPIGAIDGDKVFEWMYSNGYFSLKAADMLADEWEKGTFRLDDQGEATRLREALEKIVDVLADDTSINAQRINNLIIKALSSYHREDGQENGREEAMDKLMEKIMDMDSIADDTLNFPLDNPTAVEQEEWFAEFCSRLNDHIRGVLCEAVITIPGITEER